MLIETPKSIFLPIQLLYKSYKDNTYFKRSPILRGNSKNEIGRNEEKAKESKLKTM